MYYSKTWWSTLTHRILESTIRLGRKRTSTLYEGYFSKGFVMLDYWRNNNEVSFVYVPHSTESSLSSHSQHCSVSWLASYELLLLSVPNITFVQCNFFFFFFECPWLGINYNVIVLIRQPCFQHHRKKTTRTAFSLFIYFKYFIYLFRCTRSYLQHTVSLLWYVALSLQCMDSLQLQRMGSRTCGLQ